MENKEPQGKKKPVGVIAGIAVCLILAWILLSTSSLFHPGDKKDPVTPVVPDGSTGAEEAAPPKELSITDLLKAVLTLKDDLETALEDMQAGDTETARQKIEGLAKKTATIRLSLDMTKKALGKGMPSLQKQLTNIQGMLDLVDAAAEKLLQPLVQELARNPLSDLSAGEGINLKLICQYIDFAESLMPDVETVIAQADAVDLSLVDSDGEMQEYLKDAKELLELYREDTSIFERVKSFLGADGDRLYVLAAQNSAEIRASGGFPGAVGTVRIQNGVLTFGDFKKVYDVFSSYTPAEANITPTEIRLFHGGLSAPRDADYCPDFERVAQIWALGYEAGMNEPVDGVISMTPVVVQKLLKAVDEEITLFDGTVLNGDNAVKVLQHDIYFNYFAGEYVNNAATITDQLFADAAKKTSQKVMENLNTEDLTGYLSLIKDCFEDRTMMIWSKDEVLQNAIVKLGLSAGLNKDPQKPQVGVYLNCTVASKMGWFLLADTQVGEGRENEDGSYTYDVTVKLSNDMTAEELRIAKGYITGGNSGGIGGSAYFFAPAGGTVSGFTVSSGSIAMDEYHGLQLGFLRSFNIFPGKVVEVSFQVTTAPGVEEPLTVSQTPTMQDYH